MLYVIILHLEGGGLFRYLICREMTEQMLVIKIFVDLHPTQEFYGFTSVSDTDRYAEQVNCVFSRAFIAVF